MRSIKKLRYNASMARYRKLLKVSSIGLAAIVMAFYSYQLVDRIPDQNQSVFSEFGPGRADENQADIQNNPPGTGDQEQKVQYSTITGISGEFNYRNRHVHPTRKLTSAFPVVLTGRHLPCKPMAAFEGFHARSCKLKPGAVRQYCQAFSSWSNQT